MESRPVTIEGANTRLKETVKRCSTSDLIRFSALELQRLFETGLAGSPLQSPYKQIFHLLGLMH